MDYTHNRFPYPLSKQKPRVSHTILINQQTMRKLIQVLTRAEESLRFISILASPRMCSKKSMSSPACELTKGKGLCPRGLVPIVVGVATQQHHIIM